jgi:hypothetical protein
MYFRDYLYFGFSEDEQGRRVCDGVHIHVPGALRLYLNYRFAQPSPFTQQHRERYGPDVNFPSLTPSLATPIGTRGRNTQAIGDRSEGHPHRHLNEYWQFRASLLGTDRAVASTSPIPSMCGVICSPARSTAGSRATRRITASRTAGVSNSPTRRTGVILRALIVALEQWVKDGTPLTVASHESRRDFGSVRTDSPSIDSGRNVRRPLRRLGRRDFSPRVNGNSGVVDRLFPAS